MAGPLLGILGQAGGAMFGSQVGQAVGGLAGEVLTASDIGLPLGPEGTAALRARQREGVRRRARRLGRGRAALPRPARGRAPAPLRARAVAARPPHRGGRGLRPRHDHRHVQDRVVDPRHRPVQPGRDPGGPRGRAVRAREDPGAAGRADPARDGARARRGLGRRGRRSGHRVADARRPASCRRRCADAGRPAAPRSRRSPRWSGSSCGRAGCATPRRCGARCARARVRRPATPSGPTPTCCRPPRTSTTRSASRRGRCPRPRRSPTPSSTQALADLLDNEGGDGPAPDREVTLRDDALATLRSWRAPDDEQERLRRRYVDHLEAHADGMSRGVPSRRT